jgi:alpha-L-fucosidase
VIVAHAPTYESLASRSVPDWYHDAKLGIFVHWGLYSVPAWAPRGADIRTHVAESGWRSMFHNNPYAEWYLNTLRVGDTPTRRYHDATYGNGFPYDSFAPSFLRASADFDPDSWAELFSRVGARYMVLTTKHHDGFLLWPSASTSPSKPGFYATKRDLVGEVVQAARRRGLRAGLYYSGGLDWTFEARPVGDYMDVYTTIVQEPAFAEYATRHWNELIDRYAPAVLWNDIGSPREFDLPALFARYYDTVPDGVVNDRWSQELPDHVPQAGELINPPASRHHDFTTPEYASYEGTRSHKWEATRGIGHSYGFNRNEAPEDYLSVEQLVHHLVDVVSKNGNLLLNVGPMADGTIPAIQLERLEGLGAWLRTNGEAIFGTRPWSRAEGRTGDGVPVRFTRSGETVYAILLGTPGADDVVIEGLRPTGPTAVRVLGRNLDLAHREQADGLVIALPGDLDPSPAVALAIGPSTGATSTL